MGIKLQAAGGGMTVAIDATDAEITDALSVATNNIVGTTGNLDFTNFDITGATGDIATAGNLAVNGGSITSTTGLALVASSGNISLNASGTLELLDNTNITGNLDTSGTLAIGTGNALTVDASGNITTAGTLAVNGGSITSTGTLEVGVTGQTLTLQGNAGTTLNATDSSNTTTLNFTTPTANTTLTLPALSAGNYEICTDGGNCSTGTLQDAYDNSANPEIVLSGATGALTIRDADPALGANLLEIQSNDGAVTYLAVTATGIEVTGSIEASGDISTTTGQLVINGQPRIDNSGNLTNIGNLTATGAITIASTGAGNDITLSSADQIILNGAGIIDLQDSTTVTGDLTVQDAASATKSYRFRTSGGALDLEAGGAQLFISNWSNPDFTGTQRDYLVLESAAHIAQAIGAWQYRTASNGTVRHIVDGSAGANIIFNENGEATDFRVEGDTDTGLLFIQGSTDRVGIGTNSPGSKLDVNGTFNAGGNATFGGTVNTNTFTSNALTFGGASTATISAAASQALDIVTHGTSSWTTDTGDLSIGTSDVNGDLFLSAGNGIQIDGDQFVSINSNDALFLAAENFVSLVSDQGPLGLRGDDALITLDGDSVTIGHSSTDGTLLILDSKSDIGDPTGTNGAMYYNSAYGRFRCHQNNVWVDCISGSAREYMLTRQVTNQTTNVNVNDHIKFDTVEGSAGGSVGLDTGPGYPGIGRFTLAAGKTYRLTSNIKGAIFSDPDGYFEYNWYDVTTGAYIGSHAGAQSSTISSDDAFMGTAEAIITPSVTTVVEVRIADNVFASEIIGTTAYIEVLEGGGSGGASAAEYLRAYRNADQTTSSGPGPSSQLDEDDHIDYDTIEHSSGSSITLDTTTTYTSGGGASSGRFTLAAGKTYRLTGSANYAEFSNDDGLIAYRWYNLTDASYFGSWPGVLSSTYTAAEGASAVADAVIRTDTTTVVELRFTDALNPSLISAFPYAHIEVLSDGTSVAQFQGATDSTDGQQGFVPGPVAGQEGSLLLGDGTWSEGLAFVGDPGEAILSINSTGSDFAGINLTTTSTTAGFWVFSSQGHAYLWNEDNADMVFATNDVPRLLIDASGNITIGDSDTVGALLILDIKNTGGDPTGSVGGMYYNSQTDKFRCYEDGEWKNCIGPWRGTTSLSGAEFDFTVANRDHYEVSYRFRVSGGTFFEAARFRVNNIGSIYTYDLQSPDPGDNVNASDKASNASHFRMGYVPGASLGGQFGTGSFTISRIGTTNNWAVSGTFMCNSGGSIHMGTTSGVITGATSISNIDISAVSGTTLSGDMSVQAY